MVPHNNDVLRIGYEQRVEIDVNINIVLSKTFAAGRLNEIPFSRDIGNETLRPMNKRLIWCR